MVRIIAYSHAQSGIMPQRLFWDTAKWGSFNGSRATFNGKWQLILWIWIAAIVKMRPEE
jgi:hypothetical protein